MTEEWMYSEGELLSIYYHVDISVNDWQTINWLAYQDTEKKEKATWN